MGAAGGSNCENFADGFLGRDLTETRSGDQQEQNPCCAWDDICFLFGVGLEAAEFFVKCGATD